MVYILLIQKIEDFSGTVSDISFNMDIPDSPCQKKYQDTSQNHACKKRSTVQKLQQLYGKIFRRLPGYLPE